MKLEGKRIAILAANDYEDLELWYPYYRLKEEGAIVRLVGISDGPDTVNSKHGYPAKVDVKANLVAEEFDGVVVPGGWAPDRLRQDPHVLSVVKNLFDQGKLVAIICHGGWVAASAGILNGRRMTCYRGIKDDMLHAGAEYVDEEVVIDGNLITSRYPADLPAFCREIVNALALVAVGS